MNIKGNFPIAANVTLVTYQLIASLLRDTCMTNHKGILTNKNINSIMCCVNCVRI